jgi:hypothetical protein
VKQFSDKPCLPSFAKAKEKQRHTQANAVASHLLLPNRTKPYSEQMQYKAGYFLESVWKELKKLSKDETDDLKIKGLYYADALKIKEFILLPFMNIKIWYQWITTNYLPTKMMENFFYLNYNILIISGYLKVLTVTYIISRKYNLY